MAATVDSNAHNKKVLWMSLAGLALLGAIIGGSAGDAGKGAAAGAVAGTAASLMTRGPQLQLDAGTALQVTLDHPVTVRPSSTS